MSASLVGSEMCIRDRTLALQRGPLRAHRAAPGALVYLLEAEGLPVLLTNPSRNGASANLR
eukprot:10212077-Alexandrium_andersonii.AAC.1